MMKAQKCQRFVDKSFGMGRGNVVKQFLMRCANNTQHDLFTSLDISALHVINLLQCARNSRNFTHKYTLSV